MIQDVLRISDTIVRETSVDKDILKVAVCDFAFKNSKIMMLLWDRGLAISEGNDKNIRDLNKKI